MVGSEPLFVRFHVFFHWDMNFVVRSHRDSISSSPLLMATKYACTANFVPSGNATSGLRTGRVSGRLCFWHHAQVDPRISLV